MNVTKFLYLVLGMLKCDEGRKKTELSPDIHIEQSAVCTQRPSCLVGITKLKILLSQLADAFSSAPQYCLA